MAPNHEDAEAGAADAVPAGPDEVFGTAPVDEVVVEDGDVVDTPAEFTAEQIDALVAERDQFLDAYQRTAADFDNFRKVSQKRLTDEVSRTLGGFVEKMLPVLDAIEAAQIHAAVAGGEDGVNALASSLFGFLEKEGLERLAPQGEPFDPNTADAVVHEPGDGDPVVSEVLRTGYQWQGRVIRPAMVKVSG